MFHRKVIGWSMDRWISRQLAIDALNMAIKNGCLKSGLIHHSDREEAISNFKTAIKLMSNSTKAHYNLGIALFAERKIDEAISHYKMAIKLKPYFTYAHYNLGITLLQKRELKESVHHFRETLRLRPSFVEARNYLELAMLQSQGIE